MQELYRTEELRLLEARARAGLPPGTLMQRAGAAAAEAAHAWLGAQLPSPAGPTPINDAGRDGAASSAAILVLCGPGDNGGDGFRCAAALQGLGHACLCWAPLPGASPDAQAARQCWEQLGGRTVAQLPAEGRFALVVDGIFGIGAARPLDGVFLDAL